MQAIEWGLAAPLAQHALSPANALDAVSIAAVTNAVVIILLIVNSEILQRMKRSTSFRQ